MSNIELPHKPEQKLPHKPEQNRIAKLTESPEIPASASKMAFMERWKYIYSDPKLKESFEAISRTAANLGLSALDVLPLVGDIAEGAIFLGMKVTPKMLKALEKGKKVQKISQDIRPGLDLTPDISIEETLAIKATTAPLEALTAGVLPSYLIEALYQLYKDVKNGKFDEATRVVKILVTGKDPKPIDKEAQENLDNAASRFDGLDNPPGIEKPPEKI